MDIAKLLKFKTVINYYLFISLKKKDGLGDTDSAAAAAAPAASAA